MSRRLLACSESRSDVIIRQSRILRDDLRANPDVLYVFGDNLVRQGKGGQAAEMRGEPNAVGVATKLAPGTSEACYFSDADFGPAVSFIEEDVQPIREQLAKGGVVVVPMDGIGTGLSELPTRAPRIYEYLCSLGLGAHEDCSQGEDEELTREEV